MASTDKGKGKATAAAADDSDNDTFRPVPDHHHSLESIAWPVVRADEIEHAMEHRVHFLDDAKGRHQACMSEMAGLEHMGIHKVRLAPNTESTVLHSHLAESEWIYVLSGCVTLRLARSAGDAEDLHPSPADFVAVQETPLRPGDFAGFPAGNPKERWAHSLRAGDEEVTYLLGGERRSVDVITYPTLGRTLVSHEESAAEAMFEGRS
ncbi:hypothetical protein CspeluHIS016_0404920 [Cutaneotrichosporon spelunceum]|uniref:Cupin domain-containing protein n=1 Tax=Cutaneotrichosporon spelunceum TaxID=1672016 RepID=A0AAD3TVH3_9TREE|nr:hypothetical protein CspeluHIS016_0404920 [Cutaneotrichosporon spelunceum]